MKTHFAFIVLAVSSLATLSAGAEDLADTSVASPTSQVKKEITGPGYHCGLDHCDFLADLYEYDRPNAVCARLAGAYGYPRYALDLHECCGCTK